MLPPGNVSCSAASNGSTASTASTVSAMLIAANGSSATSSTMVRTSGSVRTGRAIPPGAVIIWAIRADNADVRVTGTHFNVWTGPEQTTVTVTEGSTVLCTAVVATDTTWKALSRSVRKRSIYQVFRSAVSASI